MPSEDSINENIEDKFTTVKEELEELIDEVKNEVDEKAIQIANNRRYQDQSFAQLHTAMDKLRKDLKQMGNKIQILARALAVSDLEQVAIILIIHLSSLSLSLFFQVVTFLPEG